MLIGGFLPTTLLDYPEKLACTVFTQGCNFRCPFCQNGSLVLNNISDSAEKYDEEEVLQIIKKRKNILEGVCISGGEPTVQKDLKEFIKKIKELGLLVKLDTNGSHPELIKELHREHLIDYVAMDIKSSKEHYPTVSGISTLLIDAVDESVTYLMNAGIPHEFRTTLVKGLHTLDDMKSIASWIAGAGKYYLQSYEDSDMILSKYLPAAGQNTDSFQNSSDENNSNKSDCKRNISIEPLESFSSDELQQFLEIARKTIPSAELRGVE